MSKRNKNFRTWFKVGNFSKAPKENKRKTDENEDEIFKKIFFLDSLQLTINIIFLLIFLFYYFKG